MQEQFDYDIVKEERQEDAARQNTEMNPRPVRKKRHTRAGTLAFTIACALVFGVIAGGVSFGVNYLGNKAVQSTVQAVEEMKKQDSPTIQQQILAPKSTDSAAQTEEAGAEEKSSGDTTVSETVLTPIQVVEKSKSAMVTISTVSVQEMRDFFYGTRSYEVEGAGTGVIVGTNETELLIATNYHVVEGATSVSVGFIDESVCEAYVKGTDYQNDLAVVGVKLESIPSETASQISVITMGDSEELQLGEQVVAIGNALGYGQSVTVGYISAFNRELNLTYASGQSFTSSGLIQTDAAINSGNSGGALLNMKGELVGINEAKSSYTSSGVTVDSIGYAIPISKAEPILEELMAMTTRDIVPAEQAGYLGVNCADVTEDIAEMYNMPVGVAFTNVIEGSPAAAAGIKKGDVLVEMEGRTIRAYQDLKNVLQYYAAGDTVELKVMRSDDGEYIEQTVQVTLADKSEIDALQTQH